MKLLNLNSKNLSKSMEKPSSLANRLESWKDKENAWKSLNGDCVISADISATLSLLRENVLPRCDDLPDLIRNSVEHYDRDKRSFEIIWAEKIAEGATHVGVLNGCFHFFRGEEILPEKNENLRISAMPSILHFYEIEKANIAAVTREKKVRFRDENNLPYYTNVIKTELSDTEIDSFVL